jgi:hypothetical protein
MGMQRYQCAKHINNKIHKPAATKTLYLLKPLQRMLVRQRSFALR